MIAPNTLERGFTITRMLDASRALVFQAWTDPAHLRWFFNPAHPTPSEPIVVDLRVGGTWRLKMSLSDETEYFTGGVYREIVPEEKLVFTWGAVDGWPEIDPERPEDCPVATVTLHAVGEKTEMVFHLALPEHLSEEDAREWFDKGIREGWSDTLDRLVTDFARDGLTSPSN